MITLDIESHPFEDGAPALPEPVGCSIEFEDGTSEYWSWGHESDNNCTKEEFHEVLVKQWDKEIITHNGCIFDVPDLAKWFDLPTRHPLLTHDTLFLSYLHDPHARELGLKPLAEDWLGMPPEEQQEMQDWILANTECRSRKNAGAYIWRVPGGMAGKYANGDTRRTKELFDYVAPLVIPHMGAAYDRERLLAPILGDIQVKGVRCDIDRLRRDHVIAIQKKHRLDDLIRCHLKQGPEFNPGSDAELGAVLLSLGYQGFLTTPTGKVSLARPSLERVLAGDPKLMALLKSRSIYDTLTGTFMEPWIRYAEANGGRIHAQYNQTRNPDGYGTRTGRLSSSKPNFQNVPKDLGLDYWDEPFPEMRTYLLPEEGQVWICGDFKNQEPRLTAHYESGSLMEAFKADPLLDPYIFIRDICKLAKDSHGRHEAKQILLGLIYAMGIVALAERLGCTPEYATMLRNMIKAAMPDVVELDRDCKRRFMAGLPITTLGGRMYHCEPPMGNRRWEYKALNTLIQGSAADQNKEAMVFIAPLLRKIGARLLGTVHDELSVSANEEHFDAVNKLMQMAANYLPCDVPMIMDVGMGKNWAEAKP